MTATYDFAGTTVDGERVPLRDYAGTVLLIVNVASKCRSTPWYQPPVPPADIEVDLENYL